MVRILVLDGDVCLRHVLHAVLEHEGYSVMEAQNDYEGLQRTHAVPKDQTRMDIRYLIAF